MIGNDGLAAVISVLNDGGYRYMIVGSYSSNFYGIPRSTKDADFVLSVASAEWAEIAKQLPEGLHFEDQGFFEMVTATRKELITMSDSDFQIELFHLSDDDFDVSRFERRVRVELPGFGQVWLPTAEDVVVQKLRWAKGAARSKDFDDVVAVLQMQKELDNDYLEAWCTKHGTLPLLAEAREAAVL
jgi:hypothetical protein